MHLSENIPELHSNKLILDAIMTPNFNILDKARTLRRLINGTVVPTSTPTQVPTNMPTALPTSDPTGPSNKPTAQPTIDTGFIPADTPTFMPTSDPTGSPSETPIFMPLSAMPTVQPTSTSTLIPTDTPTFMPTSDPTGSPSQMPTVMPTSTPTMPPSETPTFMPTSAPTIPPSQMPTVMPTSTPTMPPSQMPTVMPTSAPTMPPSQMPTVMPTSTPTMPPSSQMPTVMPTSAPTMPPSQMPTVMPTVSPIQTTYLTYQPSSHPTIQPATQFNPYTFPIVLYIDVIEISRSSVTINVTLIKPKLIVDDLTEGTLFCIGVYNDSLPTSIGGIKSVPSQGSSSVGVSVVIPASLSSPTTLSLKFTGLMSLQYYKIFCYAESSMGTGTSLEAVLQVSAAATTFCCKELDFSNAPVSVYGELSKYTGSSTSLYVFKYYLSAAPSSFVQVVPVIYLDGASSTAVMVSPLSSTFLSTSPLSGQFILSTSPLISGVYTIGFTFNGLSKSQYSNRNISVQILSSLSQLPAPVMISSQFSDSGQLVVITFDTPTDSASVASATWPCSVLFAFTGATLATCTWSTSSTVNVIFGAVTDIAVTYSGINIGSSVTLLGGHLRSYCVGGGSSCTSNPTSSNMTVLTLKPQKASAPTVIISSPAKLGPCDDLILDTTESYGNGGRLYTSVVWTVSTTTNDDSGLIVGTSAIQAFLNGFSSKYQMQRPITIPGSMLVTASYMITARLTNFLGVSSSNTIIVSKGVDRETPNLIVIGPSYRLIVASSPLTILSVFKQSSCISKDNAVAY